MHLGEIWPIEWLRARALASDCMRWTEPPSPSLETLGKSLHCSVPQFPHGEAGGITVYRSRRCSEG